MDLCCGNHGSPLSLTLRDYAALWLRAELMANAEGSGAEIVIFAPMIAILSSVANYKAMRMSQALLLSSLDLLRTGKFRPGTKMDNAHQICQEHEGAHLFDWVHALIHRIEGDDANADYWYRRAGVTPQKCSLKDEFDMLYSEL
jgi:hypothetical protein